MLNNLDALRHANTLHGNNVTQDQAWAAAEFLDEFIAWLHEAHRIVAADHRTDQEKYDALRHHLGGL